MKRHSIDIISIGDLQTQTTTTDSITPTERAQTHRTGSDVGVKRRRRSNPHARDPRGLGEQGGCLEKFGTSSVGSPRRLHVTQQFYPGSGAQRSECTGLHTQLCTNVHGASFIISKQWKQATYLSRDEGIPQRVEATRGNGVRS